jgi:hypothetical protein
MSEFTLLQLLEKARKYERSEITADQIEQAYEIQKGKGPYRQGFFFPSSHRNQNVNRTETNRHEERLAKELVERKRLMLPDGTILRLLDYQCPLKSVRADKGVGKIDLVGINEQSLALVELKTRTAKRTRASLCLKS